MKTTLANREIQVWLVISLVLMATIVAVPIGVTSCSSRRPEPNFNLSPRVAELNSAVSNLDFSASNAVYRAYVTGFRDGQQTAFEETFETMTNLLEQMRAGQITKQTK